LEQVAGTRSLLLNGQTLAGISLPLSRYEIRLPDLLERNQLEIEVDLAEAATGSSSEAANWGLISLVISPKFTFPPSSQ
jgi:hypothetical protein